jgi:hypothetical protein
MNKIDFTLKMEPETIQKNGARPKRQTSRRNLLLYAVCAVLAGSAVLSSCNSQPQITMTTKADKLKIMISGTETATVKWGDGKSETFTLNKKETFVEHAYSGSSDNHTITITGKNVMALVCHNNQLTALDVSALTNLKMLICANNQLTALDVSKNTTLRWFDCLNNQLTALDVSKNTELTSLDCGDNQLTALDVSKNTALTSLGCYINQLTALDVSKNTALTLLGCYGNQLSVVALNALFGTLHGNTIQGRSKAINFLDNPGAGGCNRSIVKSKGWDLEN